MPKPRIYYAHCLNIYRTPQEQRDLTALKQLGFRVFNPNSRRLQKGYRKFIPAAGGSPMDYFKPFASRCDAIAFRALPDGGIPAGIVKEVRWFLDWKRPVIELPSGFERRQLTVEQTKAYLTEVGQR